MVDYFKSEIEKYIWQSWKYPAGDLDSLKKGPYRIPPKHGVYIIRASRLLNRVRGSSDVIYIGQSGGGKRSGAQGIGPGNISPGRFFNTRGERRIR